MVLGPATAKARSPSEEWCVAGTTRHQSRDCVFDVLVLMSEAEHAGLLIINN